MFAQILRYVPANIVPAVLAFAAVFVFTRHVAPAEFGDYTFAYAAALLLTQFVFYAVPVVAQQMIPEATRSGRRTALMKTAYGLTLGLVLASLCLDALAFSLPAARTHLPTALWLAPLLASLNGLIGLNQSVNQVEGRVLTYSLTACGQSLGTFTVSVLLVLLWQPSALALMLGATAGAAFCVLADTRTSRLVFAREPLDRATARLITTLAIPAAFTALAGAMLIYADRFALETFGSASALGVYAVATALVERPMNTLTITVSSALYPLALNALGHHGEAAGRKQFANNLLATLAIALPAAVGVAILAHPIAAVLVGPQFRAGAAMLIPFLAMLILVRAFAAHCLDHTFYLTRRQPLMLRIYGPMAVLDAVLVCLGAHYGGTYGTVLGGTIAVVLLVAVEWIAIRRFFPLHIDLRENAKILFATLVMALAVTLVPARFGLGGWGDLLVHIVIGGAAYAAVFVQLDTLAIQHEAGRLIGRWKARPT